MSPRYSIVIAFALALFASVVIAQDVVPQPQVENSKYHFEGVINSGTVYVRSGPGEGYYPTQKLEKSATVTVVGIRFDWLKIQPPDGSFCYVGNVFVDRAGDGSTGRINRNDVNVRAGSSLNEMKTTVQTRLNLGDTVQILGTQDEYLKIAPPQGAYLYVNKEFVDPLRALPDGGTVADGAATTPAQGNSASAAPVASNNSGPIATETPVATSTPTKSSAVPSIDQDTQATAPTTQPSAVASAGPTTQPVVVAPPPPSAEDLFAQYEQQFNDMTKQPLADQKITDLKAGYQSIAKSDELSDTLKQVIQLRIATLEARGNSQTKLLEARRLEKEAQQKQMVLQAEQQELQERLRATDVEIYAAVGTLEPSSLQTGEGTLYRLTDPDTGRTVVYIRSADTKVTGLMGQFIGVKGDITSDTQLSLHVIEPTDVEVVDPNKVNGSVAAQIIPPSLLARQASARTSN